MRVLLEFMTDDYMYVVKGSQVQCYEDRPSILLGIKSSRWCKRPARVDD